MDIQHIIKNKNIRSTPARLELLKILLKHNKPICYEDIKNSIKMDKATFYRNIARFVDEDIVNSFESNDKKSYFEIKVDSHPHFICNYCHKIKCIDLPDPIALEGYVVESIILKGRCEHCQAKNLP